MCDVDRFTVQKDPYVPGKHGGKNGVESQLRGGCFSRTGGGCGSCKLKLRDVSDPAGGKQWALPWSGRCPAASSG